MPRRSKKTLNDMLKRATLLDYINYLLEEIKQKTPAVFAHLAEDYLIRDGESEEDLKEVVEDLEDLVIMSKQEYLISLSILYKLIQKTHIDLADDVIYEFEDYVKEKYKAENVENVHALYRREVIRYLASIVRGLLRFSKMQGADKSKADKKSELGLAQNLQNRKQV